MPESNFEPPAVVALKKLRARVEADPNIAADLKAALLQDLDGGDPSRLKEFKVALAAVGTQKNETPNT